MAHYLMAVHGPAEWTSSATTLQGGNGGRLCCDRGVQRKPAAQRQLGVRGGLSGGLYGDVVDGRARPGDNRRPVREAKESSQASGLSKRVTSALPSDSRRSVQGMSRPGGGPSVRRLLLRTPAADPRRSGRTQPAHPSFQLRAAGVATTRVVRRQAVRAQGAQDRART